LRKAEERSKRIIVKRRKVIDRTNLNKEHKSVKRKENKKNEDDNYMLYYDDL